MEIFVRRNENQKTAGTKRTNQLAAMLHEGTPESNYTLSHSFLVSDASPDAAGSLPLLTEMAGETARDACTRDACLGLLNVTLTPGQRDSMKPHWFPQAIFTLNASGVLNAVHWDNLIPSVSPLRAFLSLSHHCTVGAV